MLCCALPRFVANKLKDKGNTRKQMHKGNGESGRHRILYIHDVCFFCGTKESYKKKSKTNEEGAPLSDGNKFCFRKGICGIGIGNNGNFVGVGKAFAEFLGIGCGATNFGWVDGGGNNNLYSFFSIS